MKCLILLPLLVLFSCQEQTKKPSSSRFLGCEKGGGRQMDKLNGKPAMLVVGDSISIAYTPFLQEAFPEYQVIHNECNAQHSRNGAAKIKSWVKHSPRWEVCTINHGIWDMVDYYHISPEEYVTNLEFEISVLQDRCDKILFINTTSVPVNFDPSEGDEVEVANLNSLASELMANKGIPVCDIHTVSLTINHLRKNANTQDDIHYVAEGTEILANEIKNCIETLL
jgi:lysophospholipase L1-like esterase